MFSPVFQVRKASRFIGLAAEAAQRCCPPLRSAVGISHSLQCTLSEGPTREDDNQASFVGKNSRMKGFFKEQKSGGRGRAWQESLPPQTMFAGMVTGSAAHARRSGLAHAASLGPSPTHGTLQALQILLAAQPKFPGRTIFSGKACPQKARACHRPVYFLVFHKAHAASWRISEQPWMLRGWIQPPRQDHSSPS